jgi:hypothetical protein
MKSILKTIPRESDLNYDETFGSPINVEIRRKLVPELIKSLKPKFNPTHNQITQWLMSLHKSRRSRNNYRKKGRLDSDNRRLHANGRMNDVRIVVVFYLNIDTYFYFMIRK